MIKNIVQNRKKKTKNVNIFNKKSKKSITQTTTETKIINDESIFDQKIIKIEFWHIFQNFKNLKKKHLKWINFFKKRSIIHFSSFLHTEISDLKKNQFATIYCQSSFYTQTFFYALAFFYEFSFDETKIESVSLRLRQKIIQTIISEMIQFCQMMTKTNDIFEK